MGTADDASPAKLRKVAALYRKSLEEHGVSSQGVGWKDADQQLLRFDKLVAPLIEDKAPDSFSVNDLGCGYGAMWDYLSARYRTRLVEYHGYDIVEEMLRVAGDRIDSERVVWHPTSELESTADYSFVSGTFNVRLDNTEAAWRDRILRVLDDMSRHSRRGFAFNLLSTYVDWKEPQLYYGDPAFFFDHCKRRYSPYVALLHDYPLYEWTIAVRFEGPES